MSPQVEATLHLPWSYVEGTDGETLFQHVYRCEEALIGLETVASLLADDFSAAEIRPLWKRWLQSQHHDGAWHGGPQLRDKSRAWRREVEDDARNKLRAVAGGHAGAEVRALQLTTIYPVPHEGVLRIPCPPDPPAELAGVDSAVPVQVVSRGTEDAELRVTAGWSSGTWRPVRRQRGGRRAYRLRRKASRIHHIFPDRGDRDLSGDSRWGLPGEIIRETD